jgi:hypothetical protein
MVATEERQVTVQGLCSTCNHLPVCYYRLERGPVIWYCEQFDDFVPQNPRAATVSPADNVAPKSGERFQGLCVNCERRETCIHAKRLGGVWHCEEYL